MDQQTLGFWGGVLGAAIGVLGGVIGTWFSIKNTRGPRERAFVVKASVICWMLIAAFLLGMWLIPHPHRHWLWLPYAIFLPLGIFSCNRRQAKIRQGESGHGI